MATQLEWDLQHADIRLDDLRDPTQAIALVRSLREKRARISDDPNLSDEGKREKLQTLTDEATASLSSLRSDVETRLQEARKVASEAMDERQPQTDEARVAYELQLTRAHNRVQRELDAGVSPVELARAAAMSRDRVAFDAVRELAPGHVQAQQATRQGKRAATETLALQLDEAVTPLLSKAQLKAREIEARAEELEAQSTFNLNELEKEARGSGVAHNFISSRDRVIDIESGNLLGYNGRPVAEAAA